VGGIFPPGDGDIPVVGSPDDLPGAANPGVTYNVEDDGDGKPAQYVYSATLGWVKLADPDGIGSGGGPTLLGEVDAPSGGVLTIEGLDFTGYSSFLVVLIGVRVTVDQSEVTVRLRSGGAVLAGSPYEWASAHRTGLSSASSTADASVGPNANISLTIGASASWGLGNGAAEALSGRLEFTDPMNETGAQRPFTFHCGYVNPGNSGNYVVGGGAVNNNTDVIDGVTVGTTTVGSTITAGRMRIYGVP
jgi:hypothetical protein